MISVDGWAGFLVLPQDFIIRQGEIPDLVENTIHRTPGPASIESPGTLQLRGPDLSLTRTPGS